VTQLGQCYEFVFRGQLAEQALDRLGRRTPTPASLDEATAGKVALALLDDQFVGPARAMASVYTAIASFENTVRDFVRTTMLEEKGVDWWDSCASNAIRAKAKKRREEEERNRFHSQRGDDPISFIDLGDLLNILRGNWEVFEPFLPSPEWAKSIFDGIERSRNVIMHSGQLATDDVERVGINVRDWVRQVGA
jgi:hypothetical protein